jgi:hypothetical protein
MRKRLQVLLDDAELAEVRQAAHHQRLSIAAWMRQALRAARWTEPSGDSRKKLAAVRAAARNAFPTAEIDFYKGRYVYHLTSVGEAAHRAVLEVEATVGKSGSLQATMLVKIREALVALAAAGATETLEPDTLVRLFHDQAQRERDERPHAPAAEDLLPVDGVDQRLELSGGVARGPPRADGRAHARARQAVHAHALALEHLEHADVGQAAAAATAEHEAHAGTSAGGRAAVAPGRRRLEQDEDGRQQGERAHVCPRYQRGGASPGHGRRLDARRLADAEYPRGRAFGRERARPAAPLRAIPSCF